MTCSVDGCEIAIRLRKGLCPKHYNANLKYGNPLGKGRRTPELERFMRFVSIAPDGCWLWTGATRNGYGNFTLAGGLRTTSSHRWAYEFWVGPIPDDKVIDHICHDPAKCNGGRTCLHRRCVNPEHLALATRAENSSPERAVNQFRRRTHCDYGHEFSPENTYVYANGRRQCRTCMAESNARSYQKKKAKKAASVPDGVLSWIELTR